MTDPIVAVGAVTPAMMSPILQLAIEKGVSVEALEKLVALHERVADRQAAQEFADAMAAFQSECPSIRKTSEAKITTKSGAQYAYRYAELDEIASTVRPILHRNGLSYSWDSETDSAGVIKCVCTVRHANGHRVTATFSAPVDTLASMSGAQKHGAALTYARRQSLVQVLGLTMCDPDTDAADDSLVTPEQVERLEAKVSEVGANRGRFLNHLGVGAMEEIYARDYARAMAALEQKARSK